MGVDPAHLTARQLLWMVHGRDRSQWVHTASAICAIYNHVRGKGDKLIKFEEIYPYGRPVKHNTQIDKENFKLAIQKMQRQQERQRGER